MKKILSLFKKKEKPIENKIDFNITRAIKRKREKTTNKTIEGKNDLVSFSLEVKKIIRENPGLFKEVKKYLEGKYNPQGYSCSFKDGKIKMHIQRITKPSENSYKTSMFYSLEIETPTKKHKFFIKKKNDPYNVEESIGTREFKAIEILREAGFNTIEPHFAWKRKDKPSFIFYEFQEKLLTVEEAYNRKLITEKDLNNLTTKLSRVQRQVNDYLINKNSNYKITDIAKHHMKNKNSLHLYIDFENKKLYLFDPYLIDRT